MKPNFSEMKTFIFNKALSAKKKTVYNRERAIEGYENLKETMNDILQPPSTLNASSIVTSNSDSAIIDLTKQLVNLTLMMQANMNIQQISSQIKSLTARVIDRVFHCI